MTGEIDDSSFQNWMIVPSGQGHRRSKSDEGHGWGLERWAETVFC